MPHLLGALQQLSAAEYALHCNCSDILEIPKIVSIKTRCKKPWYASGRVCTHMMAAVVINLTDAFMCASPVLVKLLH